MRTKRIVNQKWVVEKTIKYKNKSIQGGGVEDENGSKMLLGKKE